MPLRPEAEINGHRYSWASIEVEIAGIVVAALRRVSYGSSGEPGSIVGSDGRRVGRTAGSTRHTCEFEILRREWNMVLEQLGQSFGRRTFDIRVQYDESESAGGGGGAPEGVCTDLILGCRVTNVDHANQEGTDPTSVSVTVDPMDIKYTARGWSIDERYDEVAGG